MSTTRDVLDHHLHCFGKGDLDGILSDYIDAVLFTPDGPLVGVDSIRPVFEAMLEEFGISGATFEILEMAVHDDCAYILWTAETADNTYEMGTDTFVIRNGKITTQSFAGKITPKG